MNILHQSRFVYIWVIMKWRRFISCEHDSSINKCICCWWLLNVDMASELMLFLCVWVGRESVLEKDNS